MKVVLRQGGAHLLTLSSHSEERKVFALVTSSDLKKTQKSSHFAAHCVLLLLNGERCWSSELKNSFPSDGTRVHHN